MFHPILSTPIKTLDLPVAGQAYSANAFKMIFDLVNMVNGITPAMWGEVPRKTVKGTQQKLEDDQDGQQTVAFLKRVKRSASLISGNQPRSLGLHPVVYFYGATGRFQPISFLATVKFISELEERKELDRFTSVRKEFEEFLSSHKHWVSTLGHSLGGRTRSLEPLVAMFRTILDELAAGKSALQVEQRLLSDSAKLAVSAPVKERKTRRTKFSTDDKSESFLQQAMVAPVRCNICGARLHMMGFNIDHKIRKQDGGLATANNGQPTHPYCNSGYKESKVAKAKKATSIP